MAFLAAIPSAIGSLFGGVSGGLGTALSAGSAVLGGLSALGTAQYQSQVAKNNAKIAEENATLAQQAAQAEQLRSDQEIAGLVGQQEAIQSASGLSTSGKSQFLTRRSTARIGRAQAGDIRAQGNMDTRNFLNQASSFRAEAKNARTAGLFGLASGILGAGTSLFGQGRATTSPYTSAFKTRAPRDPWAGLRRAV
jgi:hypothetical protein